MVEVRKARKEDKDAVVYAWREGQKSLREKGVPQWQKGGYPGPRDFDSDLEKGIGYVAVEDGIVLGYSALTFDEDPSYLEIEGEWPLPGHLYATTHRSAVKPEARGRGVLPKILAALSEKAREGGAESMRTDTHEMNTSMQKALGNAGYHLCGRLILKEGEEKGDPRLGFAKVL